MSKNLFRVGTDDGKCLCSLQSDHKAVRDNKPIRPLSALPDCGGLLKWLSVSATGMSAFEDGADVKSSKINRYDWL
jgi:hypothetical protein